MLKRDEIIKRLKQARHIDSRYELFGTEKHKYRLNPPVSASFVRTIEEKYGFLLPEDYFRFITEIGDGGAGPDYGIEPFADLIKKSKYPDAEEYNQAYRNSLKNTFTPRPMPAEEFARFGIVSSAYEQNPDRFFIYEKPEDEECHLDGFYILGTRGCQYDFGMVVTGEMRRKVLTTDNVGSYVLEADSFEKFYQNWLDRISDTEKLKKELKERRKLFRNRKH